MRLFFQPAREYSGATASVIEVAPSNIVIRTTAGVAVESGLAYTVDADGAWYVESTDALYVHLQKYLLWTYTTTSLGDVSEDHPFRQVTPTGTIPDTTPPGASAISVTAYTDTTVSGSVTPPSDGDYHHTEIVAVMIPGDGSDPVTVTTTGTTATLTGLKGGREYIIVAVAVDAAGNRSLVGYASAGRVQTAVAAVPDLPILVKLYVNQRPTPAIIYYLDGELQAILSGESVNHEMAPMTRGRQHRFRIECGAPVPVLEVRSVGAVFSIPQGEAGGLKGTDGN